jgi:hypothetical protein
VYELAIVSPESADGSDVTSHSTSYFINENLIANKIRIHYPSVFKEIF